MTNPEDMYNTTRCKIERGIDLRRTVAGETLSIACEGARLPTSTTYAMDMPY